MGGAKRKPSSKLEGSEGQPGGKPRISSYDYRSWDKFDVVRYYMLEAR